MTQIQSTTLLNVGTVVTVAIRFTNQRGIEYRPAIVLSIASFNSNSADVIVAPVSSQVGNVRYGDIPIQNWREAGLLLPSKAKAVIQTVERRMIKKQLGSLSVGDLLSIQQSMKAILGI